MKIHSLNYRNFIMSGTSSYIMSINYRYLKGHKLVKPRGLNTPLNVLQHAMFLLTKRNEVPSVTNHIIEYITVLTLLCIIPPDLYASLLLINHITHRLPIRMSPILEPGAVNPKGTLTSVTQQFPSITLPWTPSIHTTLMPFEGSTCVRIDELFFRPMCQS